MHSTARTRPEKYENEKKKHTLRIRDVSRGKTPAKYLPANRYKSLKSSKCQRGIINCNSISRFAWGMAMSFRAQASMQLEPVWMSWTIQLGSTGSLRAKYEYKWERNQEAVNLALIVAPVESGRQDTPSTVLIAANASRYSEAHAQLPQPPAPPFGPYVMWQLCVWGGCKIYARLRIANLPLPLPMPLPLPALWPRLWLWLQICTRRNGIKD